MNSEIDLLFFVIGNFKEYYCHNVDNQNQESEFALTLLHIVTLLSQVLHCVLKLKLICFIL